MFVGRWWIAYLLEQRIQQIESDCYPGILVSDNTEITLNIFSAFEWINYGEKEF